MPAWQGETHYEFLDVGRLYLTTIGYVRCRRHSTRSIVRSTLHKCPLLSQTSLFLLVGRTIFGMEDCHLNHVIDSVDVNVSPDKRTIFLHGEDSFVQALKVSLTFICHVVAHGYI